MPSYIIVKAQDGLNPDDKMTYLTGYPIDVFGHNALFGLIVPPKYCQFVITDADDFESIKAAYNQEWRKIIDWEFVGHDYEQDGHRLRIYTKPEVVSASGLNSLTRDKVESFLNKWGATVHSIAANEVVFDAIVFNAIKSDGFWGRDVSLFGWSETAYNQTTGMHTVELDYSNYPTLNPDIIIQKITDRGGEIVETIPNKIVFDIERSVVFDAFKLDVKERLEAMPYSRRKFKVPEQYVQMALDAGGTLEITQQQFATYIYNRLND